MQRSIREAGPQRDSVARAHVPRQNAEMSFERVLILGCGYTGQRALRIARERGLPVVATVRSNERVPVLEREGARVLCAPRLGAEIEPHIDGTTRVVVAFPAEPETDARILP